MGQEAPDLRRQTGQHGFSSRLIHSSYVGDHWIELPGVVVALIDTVIPNHTTGRVTTDQVDWLDALAATCDRPVLVMGHHQQWVGSASGQRPEFDAWVAEYRVFEGGIMQVVHRVSSPQALSWSERCRNLYSDFRIDYETYALGALEDRCCNIPLR